MTVAELIARLVLLPGDAQVECTWDDGFRAAVPEVVYDADARIVRLECV